MKNYIPIKFVILYL